MITLHVQQRIDRLLSAGMEESYCEQILRAAEARAVHCPTGSVGVRLRRLRHTYGVYGDESNGNEVWAIIRSGHVVTLMLRQQAQKTTAGNLDVDRIEA